MKKLVAVILGHIAFFLCAIVILFLFGSAKQAVYHNQVIFQIAACMTAAALVMTALCAICGRSKKKLPKAAPEDNTASQKNESAVS